MKKSLISLMAVLPLMAANGCILIDDSNHDHHDHGTITENFNHSGYIEKNETWSGTHYVDSWVEVQNADLHIAAGSTVKLARGAHIIIGENANLIVDGTAGSGNSVLFTSQAALPGPGDWEYITISESAGRNSRISYATFEYGGEGDYAMLSINNTVSMDNVIFSDSLSYGLQLGEKAKLTDFKNCSFEKMGSANLIYSDVDRIAELKKYSIDSESNGRLVSKSGYVTLTGNWDSFPSAIELGEWTEVGGDSSITLNVKNVNIQLPFDGRITVNKAAFNLDDTRIMPLESTKKWDKLSYTNDSLPSHIFGSELKNGGKNGDGMLYLDEYSDVALSNSTKFVDSSSSCWVTNKSENDSFIDAIIASNGTSSSRTCKN